MEADDEKTTKKGKANQATANTLAIISDDCDDFLAFQHAVTVKSPQFIAGSISLRAGKRARIWFRRWTDINLPTPPKPDLQYHMGLVGVLTNVATRLHTAEALRPVAAAQREAKN